MTASGIEAFLAVCRHKTGSQAAQALYITQSSLSIRLKTLEAELGGPLFYRKKGSREMVLTAAGQRFYQLALQYQDITRQMQEVCQGSTGSLRVSSYNSLGTYLLPQVYDRFMQDNPRIGLEIQDMELDAAAPSILRGNTDLAFTCGTLDDSRLVQTAVCREPMKVICGKDVCLPDHLSPDQLPCSSMIYVEWCHAFARWYQQLFGNTRPMVTISMMAQLQQFMKRGIYWTVAPISVAEGLQKEYDISIYQADFPLPWRDISFITPAAEQNPSIDAFCQCLRSVLAENPNITSYL